MSQGLGFLIWLLCVGISAVLIGYFLKNSLKPVIREGFVVKMCPAKTNTFVTNSGETQCCNGDVVEGQCTGNIRCTLSPETKSGLPSCTDLAKSEAAAAGANQCPLQIPNYFASSDGSLRGCSVSQPTSDRTAPSNPDQPQCILYSTQKLDRVKLDSCYNVLENAKKTAQIVALEAQVNDPSYVALRSASASALAKARAATAAQSESAVKAAVAQAAVAQATAKALSPSVSASGGSCGSEVSNPTGYVMSGDDITGEIPVLKRILIPDQPGAGAHERDQIVYLSRDSSVLKTVSARNKDIPVFSGSFPSTELPDTMDRLRELASKSRFTNRKYLIRKV
jgi:hypothetical protein